MDDVWLRQDGLDQAGCGIKSAPCRTLTHVLNNLNVEGQLNISIDTSTEPYQVCENITLHIVQTIKLTTIGQHPMKACDRLADRDGVLVIMSGIINENNNNTVQFHDASIANITFELKSVHVFVEGCIFENSSFLIVNQAKYPRDVSIIRSEYHGEFVCSWIGNCKISNDIWISGKFNEISLQSSKIYQTRFNLHQTLATVIVVKDSEISNDRERPSVAGGIRMKVKPTEKTLNIYIVNCTFTRQRSADPVDSTVDLVQASVYIRPAGAPGLSTFTEITNCTFMHNERGVFVSGFPEQVSITNCLFKSNAAIHPGAAIYISPRDKKSQVIITNSTFIGNTAGRYMPENYQKDRQKRFTVENGEVRLQSPCCNGKMDLQGKGGAIRVQSGIVVIENCNFSDNAALRLGGSIFIDYKGNVSIVNTTFYTSDKLEHVTHGSIIHSNGTLMLDGAVLYARAALDYKAVFQHSGLRWSIRVLDIQVMCPPGYMIRTSNATSYKIEPDVGLKASIILDQLSYYCEACPRLKYDLTPGYIHYKVSARRLTYLTLRIDGIAPNLAAGGKSDIIQPKCLGCPYGGVCEIGITPQNSFWGYQKSGNIEFVQCPENYCCSEKECVKYNSCGPHRQGTLCGECTHGYTESIYGSKCVPKSSCKWYWLALPASIPFLYAVFTFILVCNIKSDRRTKADKCVWVDGDGAQIGGAVGRTGNGIERTASTSSYTNKEIIGFFPLILTSLWLIQDMKFFRIESSDNFIDHIHDILKALSSFRLEDIKLLEEACVFTNLVAWQKQLLSLAMVPCYFIFFIIVVVIVQLCKSMAVPQETGHLISVQLQTGIIVIVYIVTQSLLMSTLNLVHCVRLGNPLVLYISGGVLCYQPWQYGMLAYLALCLIPLPLCFFLGPLLSFPAFNSLYKLVTGLCFPGPVLIYLILKTLRRRYWNNEMRQKQYTDRHCSTSTVLYGPYIDFTFPKLGPVSWLGFHLAYRFALVALWTYITNHLMRVLCMSITCFVFLLFHSHLRPFRQDIDNNIATGAYSLLMATGVVNCVKATFTTANRKPQGPNANLLRFLQHIENSLCIWIPALFIISALFYTMYKNSVSCGKSRKSTRKCDFGTQDMQMTMIPKTKFECPDDTDEIT